MPDKPLWYGRLDEIIGELNGLAWPWVDCETLQTLLQVGRRRAQQVLRPCVTRQIGTSGMANREELIAHLRRLAAGEDVHYERRRRQRLAQTMEQLRQAALAQPKVLVEAPSTIVGQQFADLPEGVTVLPGNISISFSSPSEALQRLLALAMAIGNDFGEFERIAGGQSTRAIVSTTGAGSPRFS
ncbi:MAG: hypothetical protein ABSH50_08870 [Bryobacteraceae bacterium]|jgi:hypothetical protein